MPDDYKANARSTGTVAVGGSATGVIEKARDVDWFAVELVAGKTYLIDLEGSGTDALANAMLYGLFDGVGNRVARRNRDGGEGNDARIVFTATESGTHYIAARGQRKNDTGTYTVSVADITDDFAAGTDTTGTVAVGGSATGAITRYGGQWDRDIDWFAVTFEKGETYRIDVGGYWEGKGTLSNPRLLGVHDAEGNLKAGTADLYDSFHTVYFAPDETATHYVAVGAAPYNLGRTYTLSVIQIPVDSSDDFTANTDTTGAVAVDGSATGEIESAGDRDWFAVTLEKDKIYQIDLQGKYSSIDMLDPAIRGIYDAGGNRLPGTMDNNGGPHWSSRLLFTPDADGTYYVAASGATYYTILGEHNTGTYTLSVEEVMDAM